MKLVVVGVIEYEGRLLLTRRPAGTHLAGLWELPGGKLEPGESPDDGLRRELREELGAEVTSLEPIVFSHHRYPEREVLLLSYRCSVAVPPTESPEGLELRWATLDEIDTLPFPPANAPLLAALRRR